MPITKSKNKSLKQTIASLIVDEDVPEGQAIYVLKTPRADAKHIDKPECLCYRCQPSRNGGLGMYGIQFTDGVALVTDATAKGLLCKELQSDGTTVVERPMTGRDLAEQIVKEFPDYKYEELA